jgi:hypothetical protein
MKRSAIRWMVTIVLGNVESKAPKDIAAKLAASVLDLAE